MKLSLELPADLAERVHRLAEFVWSTMEDPPPNPTVADAVVVALRRGLPALEAEAEVFTLQGRIGSLESELESLRRG